MRSQLSRKIGQFVWLVAGLAMLGVVTCNSSFAASNETNQADDEAEVAVKDPYETFNRHTFAFNEALDTNLLQPVARFYNKIVPKPLNKGITNFFLNLNTVSTIADDFLQFNFYQMTNDLWRLTINTTVGVGGLFDIATRMKLPYYANDFGMTLATWGYRNSNYIVLPFYGSYTIRDGLSLPVDYYLLSAYRYIEPPRLGYALYAVSVVDWRAQTLQFNDLMDAAALDKYVFVRNAYLQRRAHQIEENQHLGVYDRAGGEFSGAIDDESPEGLGSTANIDESTNIGQPANTEEASVASAPA